MSLSVVKPLYINKSCLLKSLYSFDDILYSCILIPSGYIELITEFSPYNLVEIYCDCADFKYRSAYILNQRGSLFLTDRIRNNLGAALTETPKKGAKTSFLCKHSYAVLTWLISNYTGIMRTI